MVKRVLFIALLLAVLLSAFLPQVAVAQTAIDTLTSAGYFTHTAQTKSFYHNGLQWIFYGKSTTLYYKTSGDNGEIWSDATVVRTSTYLAIGDNYSIYFDGIYVHLVVKNSTSDYKNWYRRGIPNSNGTITWSTAGWQDTDTDHGSNFSIAVDSSGYPYFTYTAYPGYWVCRSSANDGTWVTDAAFTASFSGERSTFIPLTSGKMVVVYLDTTVKAKRWTGTAWGSIASGTSGVASIYYSVVGQDDNVHIVFLKAATYDIIYTKYSYSTNSFSAETTLYEGATSTSAPVITRDTTNNDLWVWWENDPEDDHMYMAKYVSSEATWYSYYDLIDEVDDLPANGYYLNSHYTAPRDNIGVFYIAGTAILKFKSISEQFDVDTLTPTGVTETQATLRGEIMSIGWGTPHERGFYWDTTPSLGNATGTLEFWYETGSFSTGVFSHTISALAEGQTYYYIAYATNAETAWGEWVQTTAGGTEGWCVVTLEPDPVGDFEATFNGNITKLAGTYATVRGFQWGHTATATWEWTETGQFTVGTNEHEAELEADSIYYVRALVGNETVTDYGQWVGFITAQPSYVDEDSDIDDSTLTPPLPGEPGGWIRPPKVWGDFVPGIPWTAVMWLVLTALVVMIGFALTKWAKSLALLFMVLGFIIGIFCFFPKGGYLDWWVMLPYILVGWALISRQKESPVGE